MIFSALISKWVPTAIAALVILAVGFVSGWSVGRSQEQLRQAELVIRTQQKDARAAVVIEDKANERAKRNERVIEKIVDNNHDWASAPLPDDVIKQLREASAP